MAAFVLSFIMMGDTLEWCHHEDSRSEKTGIQSHWQGPRHQQAGKGTIEVGGPLRSSRQCGIDLSVFRYQSADLLQVEATVQSEGSEELGREEPQAEAPPSAWSRGLALAVLHLREQYPRWGKDKLMVLLQERGWQVSTTMVGRILSYLKARGVLKPTFPISDCGCPKNPPSVTTVTVAASANAVNYPIGLTKPSLGAVN